MGTAIRANPSRGNMPPETRVDPNGPPFSHLKQMNTYQTKSDLPPFLNEEERRCCTDEEAPEGQPQHDCVDVWRVKLKTATNLLNIATARATKASVRFSNASEWEAKLKDWIENAKTADKKAVVVFVAVKHFLREVERIGENTAKTITAVQAVLCLVKNGIFKQILKLLRVSTCAEDPKGKLQMLKLYIECNEALDESKKQDALKCIEPYEKKVTEMYGLQENIVKKLLEILERAEIVSAALGSSEEGEDEQDFALRWQLNDLRRRIIGEDTSTAKHDRCTCSGETQSPAPTGPPCGNEISQPVARLLPIRAMDEPQLPDSAYYAELKRLYKSAAEDTKTYSKEMNKAKRDSEKAAARKTNLEEAIKAAGDAENAK